MGAKKTKGPAKKSFVIKLDADEDPKCPTCGSPPSKREYREERTMWYSGKVHCTSCGEFIRYYDGIELEK